MGGGKYPANLSPTSDAARLLPQSSCVEILYDKKERKVTFKSSDWTYTQTGLPNVDFYLWLSFACKFMEVQLEIDQIW